MAFEIRKITRYQQGKIEEVEDDIIQESPLKIFVNGQEIATLMCTPQEQKALVVGFLAAEGLISSIDEISSINFSQNQTIVQVELKKAFKREEYLIRGAITSGSSGNISFNYLQSEEQWPKVDSSLQINIGKVLSLITSMEKASQLFYRTGGTHSVALATSEELLFQVEDIGRHNATDKVMGKALLEGIPFEDKILLVSGRVSSEMVLKTMRRNIPILVSRAAPTSLALEIAQRNGLAVLGFARGKKVNIYCTGNSQINR